MHLVVKPFQLYELLNGFLKIWIYFCIVLSKLLLKLCLATHNMCGCFVLMNLANIALLPWEKSIIVYVLLALNCARLGALRYWLDYDSKHVQIYMFSQGWNNHAASSRYAAIHAIHHVQSQKPAVAPWLFESLTLGLVNGDTEQYIRASWPHTSLVFQHMSLRLSTLNFDLSRNVKVDKI